MGDTTLSCSGTGELALRAAIAELACQGTLTHKSRWPKFESGGHNVNALNPSAKADMGESTAIRAVEVGVPNAGRGR